MGFDPLDTAVPRTKPLPDSFPYAAALTVCFIAGEDLETANLVLYKLGLIGEEVDLAALLAAHRDARIPEESVS